MQPAAGDAGGAVGVAHWIHNTLQKQPRGKAWTHAYLGPEYKDGEIKLIGAHITPLTTASTHVHADPTRTRSLLLHKSEISRLVGQVERAGYTLVPLNLHYSKGRV